MAKDKEIKVRVATDVEMEKVKALEQELERLKQEKIQLKINADKQALTSINNEIDKCKQEIKSLSSTPVEAKANKEQIDELVAKIEGLEQKKVDLELAVADQELKDAESEVEQLDGKEINLQLATGNIMQGIQVAKQGISELKENMDEVAQAGMQSEQNKAFLEMNLGAEKAKQTYQQISDIVASMPGDDNTMRSVLSTAQALGNNLKPDEMKNATATMADYMSASATMGKQAIESQQDIMKYLLDGNTAELERGSIVSSQVDKLKSADTFMERQAAMQQVLNDLGYGGLSQQDTMLNKQAEWEGMIYNSQDALSSMWLGAEKGAMDYVIQLNDATNGLVGMGIVAGQMAGGPLVDTVSGIGQIAVGFKALKDLQIISWFKDLELVKAAQTAIDWALAAAEWAAASPMLIIAVLIAAIIALLIALYMNSETVRNALNQLGADIVNNLQAAFTWLDQGLTSTANSINAWGDAVWWDFLNMLNRIQQWKNSVVNYITSTASNAYNGFVRGIGNLYNKTTNELNNILSAVDTWARSLPGKFRDAGVNAVKQFLGALGIASPGTMQRMLIWEISSMSDRVPEEGSKLTSTISKLGTGIVDSFGNPKLGVDTSGLNKSVSINNSNNPLWGVDTSGLNKSISTALNKANKTDTSNGALDQILTLLKELQLLNLTINVDGYDKDKSELVDEIINEITKILHFNNKTAGRTV